MTTKVLINDSVDILYLYSIMLDKHSVIIHTRKIAYFLYMWMSFNITCVSIIFFRADIPSSESMTIPHLTPRKESYHHEETLWRIQGRGLHDAAKPCACQGCLILVNTNITRGNKQ